MKKVLFGTLLFFSFAVNAQKMLQFSDPQPAEASATSSCDEVCYGRYKDEQSGATYIIDQHGISIETVVINFVTRAQIRESSKLRIRGNYLHGIKANDSVPCVEDGEKVYYGLPQKMTIIGTGNLNSLKRISAKKYVINFHEGQYFEPSLLVFDSKGLHITHPDLAYTPIFSKYLQVATITRYGENVAIIAPTNDQWNGLETLIYTGEAINYIKE
jgi:hypothetical protein